MADEPELPKPAAGQPAASEELGGTPEVPLTTIDFLKVKSNLATADFHMAQREKRRDEGIGDTLIRLGLVDSKTYNESMISLGQTRHLEKLHVDAKLIRGITPQFLKENKILPLYKEGQKLHYIYAGNLLRPIEHLLQQISGAAMTRGVQLSEENFFTVLYHHFPQLAPGYLTRNAPGVKPLGGKDAPAGKDHKGPAPGQPAKGGPQAQDRRTVASAQERRLGGKPGQQQADAERIEQLIETEDDDLIVKTVDRVLCDALSKGATDVHIEPCREYLRVRCRVDGVLLEEGRFPDSFSRAVAARIKVLASMKSHINFIPQSGRMSFLRDGVAYDMRVSVLPSIYGESVVLRVLPQSGAQTSLEERGLTGETADKFDVLIHRSAGVLLVVGPTGSGKSSTLYSALNTICTPEIKMITLEDPAEYKLDGLVQCSVDNARGYTFEEGLREILRHDPDVLLVGEIRDRVTAEIAIQASLTGHLVFSTLHTIDASSSIMRLTDIGVPIYQIEAGLIGVLAQRLVRRLCKKCREMVTMSHEAFARYGIKVPEGDYELGAPVGCADCREGFRGRNGIFELMVVDEAIKPFIRNKVSVSELRKAAVDAGMITLLEDGKRLVLEKVTTIEEIVSACV